ncbi:FeoA family protein [Desulfosporosinus sp. PR]|uniref:FeoA family protein n=1 Tax=Candidatus Desulfosporosinus nitrosoreducens TaxID=3401928 RepID=UPI0027F6023C|nr:FeoA family protein [Desulfosporosinus sp. PR]MDQ7093754.1 FeoA family protein [Desulfosporosinus sp. PR]
MEKENTAAIYNSSLSICRPRSSSSGQVIPLSMVRTGERVRVKSISGKDDTRRFLSNIGFVEDAEVTVVTEMNGNVIVNVKGTRVAISKSMASRVLTA